MPTPPSTISTGPTPNYYVNTASDVISITEDKLRIKLQDFSGGQKIKSSWLTPFSNLVTLMITLTTTSFNEAFGIKPETLEACVILLTIACICWLFYSLNKLACYFWKNRTNSEIDTFIKEIKGASYKV